MSYGLGTPVIYHEGTCDLPGWIAVTHNSWSSDENANQAVQPTEGTYGVCYIQTNLSGVTYAGIISEGSSAGEFSLVTETSTIDG